MAGVNKVILVGNLGQDPESKSFSNGGEVVNLRIATTENYKDREGNRQEKTQWHSVAIFNENVGRIAKQYLKKGSKVYLEGQLETRKWQDNNGADRYQTEVVLRQFNAQLVLLDGRGDGGGGRGSSGDDDFGGGGGRGGGSGFGGGGGSRSGSKPPPAFDSDLDDDVPF